MRYISVFSGIEAATVAWEPLGWEPVAFAEVDAFPSAVLAERYPNVPNLGDVTKMDWSPYRGAVDVVVGGSPCQSFSHAGDRESLDGESRLMFEYVRAVGDIGPTWFVWENVPGCLGTSDDAFGQLLQEMEDLGYQDVAWRVLDSQFFGVAQRRRRVFLVGHLGEGYRSAAVLVEPADVRWRDKSTRAVREELASQIGRGVEAHGGVGPIAFKYTASHTTQHLPVHDDGTAHSMTTGSTHAVAVPICIGGGQTNAALMEDMSPALSARMYKDPHIVCFADDNGKSSYNDDLCGALKVGGRPPFTVGDHEDFVIRRLTPRECERLMGFPDDWTLIPWKGKPASECPDGPRYKAIGNSMAVPVVRWIGRRIDMVEKVIRGDDDD